MALTDYEYRLVTALKEMRLDDSYGVNAGVRTNPKGRKYLSVSFCKARVLDGTLNMYSRNFVQVKWQTAFRDMPHNGSEVLTSVEDALDFIKRSFAR